LEVVGSSIGKDLALISCSSPITSESAS